jgi:A/G-specific adenine glycosylase
MPPSGKLRYKRIVSALLEWYGQHGRDLPWRQTSDPYKIWVSEIMLQQTQVVRVIDYYGRFLKRFPNLSALASARWNSVLPLWRGLGYYSRAKNLFEAAKIIHFHQQGVFPKEPRELQTLPGIGKYTSAAIASFAFSHDIPALDTNIRRVVQRLFGCTSDGVSSRSEELFRIQRGSGPTLNHALMDIGALLCKSRETFCERCPLSPQCHFFQSGRQLLSNGKAPKRTKTTKPIVDVGIACIHSEGRYLIGKRDRSRGSLWEFPGGKRERGEDIRSCLKREVREELGIEVSVRPPFHVEEWEDTEYRWRLHFARCKVLRGTPRMREHEALAWKTARELEKLPFPGKNRIAVRRLIEMGNR